MAKELPDVRVGDVWGDCDPRSGHGEDARLLRVDFVPEARGRSDAGDMSINCTVVATGKRTRIRWKRFRPTSTGYRLVERTDGQIKNSPEGSR